MKEKLRGFELDFGASFQHMLHILLFHGYHSQFTCTTNKYDPFGQFPYNSIMILATKLVHILIAIQKQSD